MPKKPLFRAAVAALTVSVAALASGCASTDTDKEGDDQTTTLTVYTDQHAELIKSLTSAYTKDTGVKFDIQQDASSGQVKTEAKNSQADVFLSEDPAPVAQLGNEKLIEKLDSSTLGQTRDGLNDPKGEWVAYAARTRALYFNPEKIDKSQLPKKLSELTEHKYKGKFAWAPSGAFVATTQYLISEWGEEKTEAFLKKVKANGVNEQKNGNIRDTVEAGKHPMGITNHYYWWKKADEIGGPDKMTSKIYHFPETDPGNLILASGAAVIKNSDNKAEAEKFVKWLASKDGGQKVIADSSIAESGAQYPAGKDMESKIVGSLDDVKSPKYDMGIFADQSEAEKLLKSLGMSR